MQLMEFTTGESQQDDTGTWLYVLEWLNTAGMWVAYSVQPSYTYLRSEVAQLDRLGYYLDRRRVRHWHRMD